MVSLCRIAKNNLYLGTFLADFADRAAAVPTAVLHRWWRAASSGAVDRAFRQKYACCPDWVDHCCSALVERKTRGMAEHAMNFL